jgi:ABC-type branched-subunit amino acid transport system substrate-binding protein
MRILLLSLFALLAACSSSPTINTHAIEIAALLPFTGDHADSGPDLERALILATERVNAIGGINGTQVALKVVDTHSDTNRGVSVANTLIDSDHVRVIIGPEEAEVATNIANGISSAFVTELLPGVASPKITPPGNASSRWFRLAPSAQVSGCTLAIKVSIDRVGHIAILAAPDTYNQDSAQSFAATLSSFSGIRIDIFSLQDKNSIESAVAAQPEAVAVFAPPTSAATAVLEFSVSARAAPAWYFPPTLYDLGFIFNAGADNVEGAWGVSPGTEGVRAADFVTQFEARWPGQPPSISAAYYYDALNLAVLATAASMHAGDSGLIDLSRYIPGVSLSPGPIVNWDQMDQGLSLLAKGMQVNYSGISGSLDLNSSGELTSTPSMQFWRIHQGAFQLTGQLARCVGQ